MSEKLINAAQAVIERWDSPRWNWGEPTASLIHELRAAVAEHQAQDEAKAASVEGKNGDTREVLLFCSYCGPEETDCTDARPCADCVAMSNIYRIDERAILLENYRRELGEIGLADGQIKLVDRLKAQIAKLRERARRAKLRAQKAAAPQPPRQDPRERIAALERTLAGRDDFIVREGLWSKFVDQLPPLTKSQQEA